MPDAAPVEAAHHERVDRYSIDWNDNPPAGVGA